MREASSSKPRVLFLVGPTASGKTAAAIHLAKRLNGEIISADSMAIYKGMDIGTAKPSLKEQKGIPHHLIDYVDPAIPYSVAEYKRDALQCISTILSRGKTPIVCGGTGLYINSLILPLDFTTVKSDEEIREKWEKYAQENGNEALHRQLATVDPVSAEGIHPNNVRRVIRALEIFECTGRPKSAQASMNHPFELPFTPVLLGITMERERLYQRCDLRVEEMLERGLIQEVKELLEAGVSPQAQSMQGIGYKEPTAYLIGQCSYEEAVERMKRNTRHLAKRQLTWFRTNQEIYWFDHSVDVTLFSLYNKMESYCLGNFFLT